MTSRPYTHRLLHSTDSFFLSGCGLLCWVFFFLFEALLGGQDKWISMRHQCLLDTREYGASNFLHRADTHTMLLQRAVTLRLYLGKTDTW